MNTKTFKIVSTILMAIFVLCAISQVVLADSAMDVANGIKGDSGSINASGLQTIANRVIGLLQVASAVAAVVLITVFGFKFIMGSAGEKVEYQKSFIPLIVGVVVVFAASSIAKLIFSTFTGLE